MHKVTNDKVIRAGRRKDQIVNYYQEESQLDKVDSEQRGTIDTVIAALNDNNWQTNVY